MSEEGGFDMQAYKAAQGNPDKALIVTFGYEAIQQSDGSYKNQETIRIWLGRNDEIVRPATAEDKIRFKERYEAFKAGTEVPEEGTPVQHCAIASPADIASCKAERILTLEQLVETPDERLQRMKLVSFKYRAKDWLKAQQSFGYVGELRSRIDKLEQENKLMRDELKGRGKEVPEVEVQAPKKRGRPPKVKDGNVTDVGEQRTA